MALTDKSEHSSVTRFFAGSVMVPLLAVASFCQEPVSGTADPANTQNTQHTPSVTQQNGAAQQKNALSAPGSAENSAPATVSLPTPANADATGPKEQSKRILGIIPNYLAVSADSHLPPLSVKSKFVLATQDSFDYSSFLVAGSTAGLAQARNAYPEFHQGAAGYGRYFWHSFADQAVGNYFTVFIVPSIMRQDPRYYTRGHGGVFRRTGYSLSRLLVTRTDSGGETFNFSEIVGNGAASGVSSLYYPRAERTWTKVGQRWASQIALDGLFNVLKEFWPDVRHGIFRK